MYGLTNLNEEGLFFHIHFHRHDSNDPSIKLPCNINLTHNDTQTLLVTHSKECTGIMTPDMVSVNSNDKCSM